MSDPPALTNGQLIAAVVGIVGGAFSLFTAVLTLRKHLEDCRDVVLGLRPDGEVLNRRARYYLLKRSVASYMASMLIVLLVFGAIFTVIGWQFLHVKILAVTALVFGGLSAVAAAWIFYLHRRDYREWTRIVLNDEWPSLFHEADKS